jgi:hypothetical protein
MSLVIEIGGWIGSFMVLLAYGLNSYKKLASDSLQFYLLNIVGGLLLVVYTVYKEAFANTFINVVWVLIAIPAIINVLRAKAKKTS